MTKRILTFSDLRQKGIFYARQHIRRLEAAGAFPRHLQLSVSRIGWLETEIDDWIDQRAAARFAPAADDAATRRKRGRPRKHPLPVSDDQAPPPPLAARSRDA